MILSYNTNGLANLDAIHAFELLHDIGYQGIAITLDHRLLNPFTADAAQQLEQASDRLQQLRMRSAIETGARFLLDANVKHEPTLVTADPAARANRIDFLRRAIDVASMLEAECVSLWSGIVRDGAGDCETMDRLASGVSDVLCYADERNVVLAFEPEPGMFIDTLDRYADLLDELARRRLDTSRLRLTIDIGHLHCMGELPIADKLRQWRDHIANIHIEDMRAGLHEHLMFGDGEINFPPVIAALAEIRYAGLVNVELTRHAPIGPAAARQAYQFLKPLVDLQTN